MKLTKLVARKETTDAAPVAMVSAPAVKVTKLREPSAQGTATGRTQTATPNEKTKTQPQQSLAGRNAKLATLAADNLREFICTHAEVMEELFALADQYEELLIATKAAIKDEERKDVPNFKVTGGALKEVFSIESLPPAVLTRRGVVKVVDNDVIQTLLKAGALSPAEAEATNLAKRTETSSLSVGGPIGEFKIAALKKLLLG